MVDRFIADTEKLLRYIGRIEDGELLCIGPAERLAEQQGLGTAWLQEAIESGVGKKVSGFLRRIRDGEDADVYAELIRELAREHNLDQSELDDRIEEAVKEAELRRFTYYVNMIENENIHLVARARAIQEKYGLDGTILEDAISRGEYRYLLNNIKQIKRGPHFHPLHPREEKLLRKLAQKHGHEAELEDAVKQWRALSCPPQC